jgi:catechol 2,3-dioxygenase-like lactoylglutathione lyase family enzyme
MLHAIDHLVIVVPDLAAAITTYRELGFAVTPGGRHPGVGTDNALVVFRDASYLELLAFHEPRPDHRWWSPFMRGGGLVDFCLQSDDLTGDAKTLRQAGVQMSELGRGARQRPDGVEVRWAWVHALGAHRGVAPFLLAEDGPRDARVPRGRGHANGVTGIGTMTVVVDDLAAVRRWYSAALGKPGEDLAYPELGATGARFDVGAHVFEFLAPAGAGPIRDWLHSRGPSPYSATLVGGDSRGPLDLARTAGARLALA